jgi:hypothetical protein
MIPTVFNLQRGPMLPPRPQKPAVPSLHVGVDAAFRPAKTLADYFSKTTIQEGVWAPGFDHVGTFPDGGTRSTDIHVDRRQSPDYDLIPFRLSTGPDKAMHNLMLKPTLVSDDVDMPQWAYPVHIGGADWNKKPLWNIRMAPSPTDSVFEVDPKAHKSETHHMSGKKKGKKLSEAIKVFREQVTSGMVGQRTVSGSPVFAGVTMLRRERKRERVGQNITLPITGSVKDGLID